MDACIVDKVGEVQFTWSQSLDEVNLVFLVPLSTRRSDIRVSVSAHSLKMNSNLIHIDERLENVIVPEECIWFFDDSTKMEDNRVLRFSLAKAHPGLVWTKVFSNQTGCLDLMKKESARKALLLERFSLENPGFDFSQAVIDGNSAVEPRSFLGGFTL